jgi:adenine-specific DNA methylase
MTPYPKRLIEVDLPIARISAHARREKSIRHGHISTLHIWWARRPLAACRAVILASLWPDPEDLVEWAKEADRNGEVRAPRRKAGEPALKTGESVTIRPRRFLDEARTQICRWADNALAYGHKEKISKDTESRLSVVAKNPALLNDPAKLRESLLDFIADFADWDHSTDKDYLDTARALTQAAHEALGGDPHTRPMVIDPFAGGGSIPLEALRVGADAFASDLNPIPVLLNKVVLEYIPKYGQRLADEVRRWGQWIKEEAEKELAAFYPKDKDGSTPIAYLWARTILSEAPGQGDIPVEVPLMRSLWLAKKAGRRRALRWVRDDKGNVKTQTVEVAYVEDGQRILKRVKRPVLEIFEPAKESEVEGGTVARGSATCPVTGFTTKVDRVRAQLKSRRGGAADARLFCVVTTRESEQGRFYRLPTKADQEAFDAAAVELERREKEDGTQRSQKGRRDAESIEAGRGSRRSLVPDEAISHEGTFRILKPLIYGMDRWGDLFSPRQALALTTLAQLVREAGERLKRGETVPNGAEKDGITGTKTTSAGTKGASVGTEMISAGTKGTFAGTKIVSAGTEMTSVGPKTLSAGTKKGFAGTGEAPAARSTSIPPASGRSNGVFSGLSSDSEDDRADIESSVVDAGLADAVQVLLALVLGRQANACTSLSRVDITRETVQGLYARQAIGMVWDFVEVNPFSGFSGDWDGALAWVVGVLAKESEAHNHCGHIEQASATAHPLPDDAAAALVTDPPYYDSVAYAYLSDFFYVWMRRTLADVHPALFRESAVPKDAEIIVDMPHKLNTRNKDIAFYEREMTKAFAEGRRVLAPSGVGTIVFASKTTESWEAILKAVIDAGFIITGSWPIDTEMETRVAAQGQARLGSSVHIVVRPRENPDGTVATGDVGEWREVLAELPKKMEDWMPRLAEEGVVGADAIFACIGPALEIFSRYKSVEKASGAVATLGEYLEHVWAAVSSEALSMIFKDADAAGLEPDARLTAMWLWTLGDGKPQPNGEAEDGEEAESEDDEETTSKKSGKVAGFVLEFDAARKIAQGLGIHLERSESIVEVKGDSARLLPVSERTRHLFGKDAEEDTAKTRKAKKKAKQGSLFEELDAIEAEAASTGGRFGGGGGLEGAKPGATVLDKVHQSMILFAAGRGEALKRFLVEDGVGKDGRFWKLAQSLSALYPTGTDEKRWVDGVLARKKGLGF